MFQWRNVRQAEDEEEGLLSGGATRKSIKRGIPVPDPMEKVTAGIRSCRFVSKHPSAAVIPANILRDYSLRAAWEKSHSSNRTARFKDFQHNKSNEKATNVERKVPESTQELHPKVFGNRPKIFK